MRRIVVASQNPGKIREIERFLGSLQFEVLPQSAFNVREADEPHCTFIENALAKARNASLHSGLPALADDSGICVDALGGEPGVHSARFAGEPKSDERNNRKLLSALAQESNRNAQYYCVLILLRHSDDPQPLIAEGAWHGEIARTPRGEGGFGYDPLFWLPDFGKTAAELTPLEKNEVSHRGRALSQLLAKLAQEISVRGDGQLPLR